MRPSRRTLALLIPVALLCWQALSGSAWANPANSAHPAPAAEGMAGAVATAADPVTTLLVERGLLPSSALSVSREVRDRASDLVLQAMAFLGVPYRRGGDSAAEGFDCSGFTRYVFENSLGLVLPRRSAEQATAAGLVPVLRDDLKPGDLVFFNTMRRAFSHVGIYVGDGKFIHAPRAGATVRIEDMRQAYWSQRYNGARRAEGAAGTPRPDLLRGLATLRAGEQTP
jgi:cell wall-associated NlpC family hydrolase